MANTEFDRQAVDYSKYRPTYPQALFDFLMTLVSKREAAFDAGCGNGQCTVDLASRFSMVYASDLSREQVDLAVQRANIKYFVAAAHDPILPPESVDLISAATAIHWFNFEKFFKECERILRPNGILAAWSYDWHQTADPKINEIFDYFGKIILADSWSPQPKHIWNGYRDIPFPFFPLATPNFFSDVEWNLQEFLGYLSSWSGTQNYIRAKGVDPRFQIMDHLERAWGEQRTSRTFRSRLVLKVCKKI